MVKCLVSMGCFVMIIIQRFSCFQVFILVFVISFVLSEPEPLFFGRLLGYGGNRRGYRGGYSGHRGGYYGKRSANPEAIADPEPAAEADPYYGGYSYGGYGYGDYSGHGGYGGYGGYRSGYYGKRSAELEANANAPYGNYGYNGYK